MYNNYEKVIHIYKISSHILSCIKQLKNKQSTRKQNTKYFKRTKIKRRKRKSLIKNSHYLLFIFQHFSWHSCHHGSIWHITNDNCACTYQAIFAKFMHTCHYCGTDTAISIFVGVN